MNKIKLVQCYHCYALVDHKRPSCPLIHAPQRCPRCGQTGHKSWECLNPTVCIHCNGPHSVTAPCCPIYKEKMEETMSDLLAELLSDTNLPQNLSSKNNVDALNLLISSALTANGSFINFINSLFTATLDLAQPKKPIISYPPYSLPLTYNSDWEVSSNCISRSSSSLDLVPLSEDPVNSPATSLDPLSNLLTPSSDLPLDPSPLHQAIALDPIQSPECPNLSQHQPSSLILEPSPDTKSESNLSPTCTLTQSQSSPNTKSIKSEPDSPPVSVRTKHSQTEANHVQPISQSSSKIPDNIKENPTEIQKTCWAKILAPDLFNSKEVDILEFFIEENPKAGIIDVKRFIDGHKKPTSILKFKFKGTKPPHKIYCLGNPYTTRKL